MEEIAWLSSDHSIKIRQQKWTPHGREVVDDRRPFSSDTTNSHYK